MLHITSIKGIVYENVAIHKFELILKIVINKKKLKRKIYLNREYNYCLTNRFEQYFRLVST